ncbi:response regulator [Microvirga massiliensis]|uniref:response regulator n=1 Tax=Microvirga massiliensis TaxID=1033741 RepID=UPI00062B826E|nr:response regulator [Microvirga massiliensis]
MRTNTDALRIMIVEDEAVIALVLADALKDEGYRIVGPFARQHEALAMLDYARPDAAILDLTLQDGVCSGLARELRSRDLPFLVYSGHDRKRGSTDDLDDVPWIEKPGRLDEITAALDTLVLPDHIGTRRNQ